MLVCEVADAPDHGPEDDLDNSAVPSDTTDHDQAADPTSSQTTADWSLGLIFQLFVFHFVSLTFHLAKRGSTC